MTEPVVQVRVLLIDDDDDMELIIKNMLSGLDELPASVDYESTYSGGLHALTQQQYDICLLDYRLTEEDGLVLLRRAIEKGSETPIILLTGIDAEEVDIAALRSGAADFLHKNELTSATLYTTIRYALERKIYITARHEAEHALEASEAKSRAILNAAGEGIYGVNLQGNATFINPAAAKMIDWPAEQLIGQFMHNILHHSKADTTPYPAVECPTYRAFKKGQVQQVSNEVFWRRNGTCFPVEYTSAPVSDEQGDLVGAVVVFRDVTEQKQLLEELIAYREHLEERVKLRTMELTAANDELEAFTHTISHDLKAPLRAIEGFSEALVEDYQERLDETGNQYLEEIQGGAVRMGHLINDLLSHVRLGANIHNFDTVNLTDVVSEVRDNLGADIQAANAEIQLDGVLPTVLGHWSTLVILVQNLVNNAIKFAEPEVPPVVRIGSIETPSEFQISVEDNGIGIAPEYRDTIFDIFQRLHSDEEYPGTGIGLAIVKKAAALHQGKVWVESGGDSGCIFYFSLSKNLIESGEHVEEAS